MADMSKHDPQDTCPFSDHVEYNKAMRAVFGDKYEPVSSDEFEKLREHATCSTGLVGTPVVHQLQEAIVPVKERPEQEMLPPRPEEERRAALQRERLTPEQAVAQWRVVRRLDEEQPVQQQPSQAIPARRDGTSRIVVVSSVVAALGVLTILGIMISRK